jgi:hypothetical protein
MSQYNQVLGICQIYVQEMPSGRYDMQTAESLISDMMKATEFLAEIACEAAAGATAHS